MEKQLVINESIVIDAPASRVWDALTNPEQTKKYMYGCEALSDWKVNSPLLWKGVFDGKELVAVKGIVKEIRKDQLLAFTAIDPNNAAIPDVPENYTTITYKLTSQSGQTRLDVSQGDFATVAEGEKRYKDVTSDGGWYPLLEQIKKVAEQN